MSEQEITYRLERLVDDEWCYWGEYNVANEVELNAMIHAAYEFGKCTQEVRIVRI